jgi:DNA-binding MarR family transcriptional regulator
MLDEHELAPVDLDGAELTVEATADHIGHDLARLMRSVTRMRQQTDMAIGFVLGLLIEKGPQRVGEIAHALGTDPSTVSRKVAALVDAGLVERRVDPDDGRAHLLAATQAGERNCVDGRRRRIDVVASVLAEWPEDSRRQLATLLARFADGMQEHGVRMTRPPGGENR